jgi:hypothetical protein
MSGARLLVAILLLVSGGCGDAMIRRPAGSSAVAAVATEEPVLLGPLTREEIEEAMPEWSFALVEAEPDLSAATQLSAVPPGAEVTVFFGSWCSDSRRELTRLWRALDMIADDRDFVLRYIGVDREKRGPSEWVAGRDILFVPTLIVEREGGEVGRIIEESPRGVEIDLLALLEGDAEGWISKREDVAPVAKEDREER